MNILKHFIYLTSFIVLLAVWGVHAQEHTYPADVTGYIIPPTSYYKTPADLEADFPALSNGYNPYFKWLNEDKTRAIFKRRPHPSLLIDLTLFERQVKIDEMIVDFKDGVFLGATVSVFNRGDSGKLDIDTFHEQNQIIGKALTDILATNAQIRTGNLNKGIMTSGYIWKSERGYAALEYNNEAPDTIEFVRLKLGHPKDKGTYKAAMEVRSFPSVRKSSLPDNVKKEGSRVFIYNIPMVDQGAKGYCVVASAQRVFEYYGISCDMHQLAQIAGSDPDRGTDTLETNRQLGSIDYRFKTRYECLAVGHQRRLVELEDNKYVGDNVSIRDFEKKITRYIDKGIPLLWSLMLGEYPENPPLNEQTSGGHMRLITGYDLDKRELIFSDSWGLGHEEKSMSLDHAYKATSGLFVLSPIVN